MFQVHGLAGRLFTTRAETLRRVERVPGAQATTPVADTDEVLLSRRVDDEAAEPAPQEPAPHRTALQAYAELQGAPTDQGRRRRPVVASWMTRDVHWLALNRSLSEALALLERHRIAQAPVLDPNDRLVGLLLREEAGRQAASRATVATAMLSPVPAAAPDTDLRTLSLALLNTGLPGLPVVGPSGELIGIITRSDVLRAVATEPPLDLWG